MGAFHRSTSTHPLKGHFPAPSSPLAPRRQRLGPGKDIVLIAEDVEDIRDLYVEFFQFRGFRTAVARDGEEAVALALSLRPHVIVMDLKMPRLNGVGATRRLSAVRWGVARQIVWAWVLTIPAAFSIAAVAYKLLALYVAS